MFFYLKNILFYAKILQILITVIDCQRMGPGCYKQPCLNGATCSDVWVISMSAYVAICTCQPGYGPDGFPFLGQSCQTCEMNM